MVDCVRFPRHLPAPQGQELRHEAPDDLPLWGRHLTCRSRASAATRGRWAAFTCAAYIRERATSSRWFRDGLTSGLRVRVERGRHGYRPALSRRVAGTGRPVHEVVDPEGAHAPARARANLANLANLVRFRVRAYSSEFVQASNSLGLRFV